MGSFGHVAGADVSKVRTAAEGKEFPLGSETEVVNSDGKISRYVYVEAGGALEAGKVYQPDVNGTVKTGVTTTTVGVSACIPQVAIASGSFGWALIDGVASAIFVAASCAKDVALYTTATAGILDDAVTKKVLGSANITETATTAGVYPGFVTGPIRIAV